MLSCEVVLTMAAFYNVPGLETCDLWLLKDGGMEMMSLFLQSPQKSLLVLPFNRDFSYFQFGWGEHSPRVLYCFSLCALGKPLVLLVPVFYVTQAGQYYMSCWPGTVCLNKSRPMWRAHPRVLPSHISTEENLFWYRVPSLSHWRGLPHRSRWTRNFSLFGLI